MKHSLCKYVLSTHSLFSLTFLEGKYRYFSLLKRIITVRFEVRGDCEEQAYYLLRCDTM
jgi:hypothetical protein